MSIGRHLRVVAVLLTTVCAGVSGAAATASAAGVSGAGAIVTPADVCAGSAGRSVTFGTNGVTGVCTSSVVAPADVSRATSPYRRLSAGAWTTVARPAWQSPVAMVDAGAVTACPPPPPAANHSRAPPSP